MVWKRWKRGTTRYQELRKLERAAIGAVGKSPWHMSRTPVVHEALCDAKRRRTGLESIEERYSVLHYSC